MLTKIHFELFNVFSCSSHHTKSIALHITHISYQSTYCFPQYCSCLQINQQHRLRADFYADRNEMLISNLKTILYKYLDSFLEHFGDVWFTNSFV